MDRYVSRMMVLAAVAALLGLDPLSAHGGRYRGGPLPGTILPPQPGSSSGSSTGPATPSPAPRPYVPPPIFTPRPSQPAGIPNSGPRTPRGLPLGLDVTRWQLWWEMNKDRYLLVKRSVHSGPITGSDEYYLGSSRRVTGASMAPHAKQTQKRILPALLRALRESNNPDLVTSCLLGMAKIGKDTQKVRLLDVIAGYLAAKHQEIRETAALALGVSRRAEALDPLRDLLLDNAAGRKLAKRAEVDSRSRAFAAYGLGILMSRTNADVRRKGCAALLAVLRDEKVRDRDIKVAVINAIGVMRPESSPYRSQPGIQSGNRSSSKSNSKDKMLLWRVLPALSSYYEANLGKSWEVVQAHVPIAIGRLLGGDGLAEGLDAQRYRGRFLEALGTGKRRSAAITQSAAIALGLLSKPEHKAVNDRLHRFFEMGRDRQTRHFSLIAMGEIGGDVNRTRLLRVLSRGKKALERPWAALGLGILAYKARRARDGVVDVTIGRALEAQLATVKNKETGGAFAVALGLSGYTDAAARMRKLLDANVKQDDFAGYLCLGLALSGDTKSIGSIRAVLHRSVRRPLLLRQSAIALGRLEDKFAVPYLMDMLVSDSSNTARMAAVAGALQFIGDRRTVDALLEKLADDQPTKLARAFVAAALGGIADPELLPFPARYAADGNYRAAVPTLTDQATGILDLL